MGGKQKVVVRVSGCCCDKGRSVVLKTVADQVPGLTSMSLEGAEKDLLVVIGEGIDSYTLVKSLRKKVGCAKLETVGPVEEKKPPEPKPAKPPQPRKPNDTDEKQLIQCCVPCSHPEYVIHVGKPPMCNLDGCFLM